MELAIALRLLAGGASYDLSVIFDIHHDHCTIILYEVLLKWVIETGIGDLNTRKYLRDREHMAKVSKGFSKRSNGILKGAIDALDEWLVRIVKPGKKHVEIRNPLSF